MNPICMTRGHKFEKVYPDQDLIDSIRFVQPIEEIWVCERCGLARKVMGTVGSL